MKIRDDSPDVVYFVKEGEDNEELRYSIRSLKNLNHGKVFIIGYKPSWVSGRIIHIPTEQLGKKYDNVSQNWSIILGDPRISDTFVLMNDDFFIMKPTLEVSTLRRTKPIEFYIDVFTRLNPVTHYLKTMRSVRDLLKSWGHETIDSYELHVPMLFEKSKLEILLQKAPDDYRCERIRTLYGNYFAIGGDRIEDVKVVKGNTSISFEQRFLSTIDDSFVNHPVGDYIRKKFARVLIFAHANDPDGLLSVILAQLAFHKVDYLLTNSPQSDIMAYIDKLPSLDAYDYVFISDIYPGRSVLEALPDAYWFDHKQHSIDKMAEHSIVMPHAYVRTEQDGKPTSASQLMYQWLVQERLLPPNYDDFVDHMRRVDTWDY